jgi:YD repeat-containing protein
LNGLTYNRAYNAASRMITDRTPMGRRTYTTLDLHGRPTTHRQAGLQARIMAYDSHGRLESVALGGGKALRKSQFYVRL